MQGRRFLFAEASFCHGEKGCFQKTGASYWLSPLHRRLSKSIEIAVSTNILTISIVAAVGIFSCSSSACALSRQPVPTFSHKLMFFATSFIFFRRFSQSGIFLKSHRQVWFSSPLRSLIALTLLRNHKGQQSGFVRLSLLFVVDRSFLVFTFIVAELHCISTFLPLPQAIFHVPWTSLATAVNL